MTQDGSLPHLKQSTLVTLGYVCAETFQHLKQDEVDSVLAVILQGMNQSENTAEVSVTTTNALFDSLDFLGGSLIMKWTALTSSMWYARGHFPRRQRSGKLLSNALCPLRQSTTKFRRNTRKNLVSEDEKSFALQGLSSGVPSVILRYTVRMKVLIVVTHPLPNSLRRLFPT